MLKLKKKPKTHEVSATYSVPSDPSQPAVARFFTDTGYPIGEEGVPDDIAAVLRAPYKGLRLPQTVDDIEDEELKSAVEWARERCASVGDRFWAEWQDEYPKGDVPVKLMDAWFHSTKAEAAFAKAALMIVPVLITACVASVGTPAAPAVGAVVEVLKEATALVVAVRLVKEAAHSTKAALDDADFGNWPGPGGSLF